MIDVARQKDLGWVGLMMVGAVGGVCLTFTRPLLCAALMACVLAASLYRWRTRRDVLIAVAGFVFGPTLEVFSTSADLWRYPYATFGALPAWVFTLWPAFPVVLVRFTHALIPIAPGHMPRPLLDLGVGLAIVFIEIPLLALFGNAYPWATAAVTLIMVIVSASLLRTPQGTLMLALSGTFGVLCESLPIALGAWSYPHASLLGMPAWLPTGYALFGFGLVRAAIGLDGLLARGATAAAAPETR